LLLPEQFVTVANSPRQRTLNGNSVGSVVISGDTLTVTVAPESTATRQESQSSRPMSGFGSVPSSARVRTRHGPYGEQLAAMSQSYLSRVSTEPSTMRSGASGPMSLGGLAMVAR